mmetsp:Transcript_16649/g.46626  ORF Transcript_16649/g.46626 Transcript_16649/m.46626 type:complete len:477 (-) Transcript_16649:548-1978(-)
MLMPREQDMHSAGTTIGSSTVATSSTRSMMNISANRKKMARTTMPIMASEEVPEPLFRGDDLLLLRLVGIDSDFHEDLAALLLQEDPDRSCCKADLLAIGCGDGTGHGIGAAKDNRNISNFGNDRTSQRTAQDQHEPTPLGAPSDRTIVSHIHLADFPLYARDDEDSSSSGGISSLRWLLSPLVAGGKNSAEQATGRVMAMVNQLDQNGHRNRHHRIHHLNSCTNDDRNTARTRPSLQPSSVATRQADHSRHGGTGMACHHTQHPHHSQEHHVHHTIHHTHTHVVETKPTPRPQPSMVYQAERWEGHFHHLLAFKHAFGHCNVPSAYQPNQVLARWVKRQRRFYHEKQGGARNSLTDHRQRQLEEAGFVWDTQQAVWDEHFEDLRAFYEQTGHCNVNRTSAPGKSSLAAWVKWQRRYYRTYLAHPTLTSVSMSPYRISKLNSINFEWEPRSRRKNRKSIASKAAMERKTKTTTSGR